MSKKSIFSVLGTWVNRVIFPSKETDRLAEEKIVSPGKQMFKRFLHNRLAMTGLIIFLSCLLLVTVGPIFFPQDLSYTDGTQQNIAPGYDMMKLPTSIVKDVVEIQPGATYGFALTDSGEIVSWGKTAITSVINLADIPDEVKNADIVQLAVGVDHAIAADADGKIYTWGSNRLGQLDLPRKVDGHDIKQLVAGNYFAEQREFNLRLQANNVNFDQYLKVRNQTVEQFRAELHAGAEQKLRGRLGLLLVAEKEQLWPTEAEVDAALAGWKGERTFPSNDRRKLRQGIASQRAAAFVRAHSTLTPPPAEPEIIEAAE